MQSELNDTEAKVAELENKINTLCAEVQRISNLLQSRTAELDEQKQITQQLEA